MRMGIREEGAARREGKIYCVESEFKPVGMLRVCIWRGMEWVLPWSRFELATFQHEEEVERIEICFAHHQVTVVGKNLREAMDDIRAFQVRCLRDVPRSLHVSVDSTEAMIERLEVRSLNEPTKAASASLPF